MAKADPDRRVVAQIRRARHDYFIENTIEAGIMLLGSAVKALREGKASIGDSFAADQGGQLLLIHANLTDSGGATLYNHEPEHARDVLVHCRDRPNPLASIQHQTLA